MTASPLAQKATDAFNAPICETDPEIAELLDSELGRQRSGLEMIASENFVPRAVLQCQGSVLTNKYAEGYPGRFYHAEAYGVNPETFRIDPEIIRQRTFDGAKILAERLLADDVKANGIFVLTGGTDVHLVMVDLRNSEMDGQQGEDLLAACGITINRNTVPFDPRPASVASGLRIGTSALATRGFGPKEYEEVADIIGTALAAGPSADVTALKARVDKLAEDFPLYPDLGAADVFLETERKVSRMFSLEERSRAVELYLTTPMTTAQVVECLGYPTRQCLERWLAMDPRYAGRMAKPIIPLETRRKAIELVLGGMQQKQAAKQLGVSVGAVHNWVRAYRRGGMAALQPRNQNAAQGGKSASVRPRGGADAGGGDDVEALRRRVEELELENALMREVVEVVKKDPGADLRRLSNREKTMLIDRLRPRYSLRSMACLLRIAPSSYHYHHARIGVDKYAGLRARVARAFADSKGRYGYRRVKAALGTGVSEKVIRRLMAEGGLSAHVPKRRRYSSYEGETTPAPGNLVNRDFTAERPNEKWLTDITEIKASDGKVYLSPMIDCHDGKIVAYTAGFHPNAELANRMLAEAAETLPDNARPVVHSDRGCHYRWPGWLELMERYGLTRSMSAKGCSPDNAAAEGFFGRMKTESVYPEHWEKRTRDEVLVLIDEYIHWYNHERIKQSLGWMSPVQYRQSQGMAA